MALVDIATIQTIATGQPFLAATLQQIRDNDEFFAEPPSCSVYASSAQTVGNSSPTALTANSENFDNDSMHSTASNTSRVTVQTAGRYLVYATVQFAADGDGVRNVRFRIDGTTSYECIQVPAVSTVNSIVVTAIRSFVLSASQYVECIGFHTAGNNLGVTLLEFGATWMTR